MRLALCLALSAAACRSHAPRDGAFLARLPLGATATLPVPPDLPLACERVELGRRLFFEPRLSRGGRVSCATCHVPGLAFTDGRTRAVGDDGLEGRRHSPTLLDRAYGASHFWDGRVSTLEEQAVLPLTDPRELGNSHGEIERRLSADASYRRAFSAAFGRDSVTVAGIGDALASFVRTLVAGDAPVDRFLVLGDSAALSPEALRGFELFRGKAGCVRCHEPPHFTDERFHNTGVAWTGAAFADSGRYEVTRRQEALGSFKTPTLRNVALTAPYMHNGSIATLDSVVAFYARGGSPNPQLDPLIRPLDITANERSALLAFLRALTGRLPGISAGRCG